MTTRHVETLYCDDIRQEIGGKFSFIGVYSGSLFVHAFPATLAKLCLLVRVVTPARQPLRSLILRVLRDEEVLQEIVVEKEQLETASDSAGEPGIEHVHVAQFFLVFSPISFEKSCVLRVHTQTEDGEYKGISLDVSSPPPSGWSDDSKS